MLKIQNLSAAYSGIQALSGVNLQVQSGEMVALIGANGAGKTTLLNCISGMVRPRSGSIIFEETDLTQIRPWTIAGSGVLQVPEGRLIISELSVLENLQLGETALNQRNPTHQLNQVFELFPILQERSYQRAGSLSGGEQQMLAIGRALMGAPRLMLLDEPSLGLGPLIVQKVFQTLKILNQGGLTILLVEQNAKMAFEITDRAYVLEQGKIVLEGESAALSRDERVQSHYLGQSQSRD